MQVAAVCYRWKNSSVEFLLVKTTGGGRWTFPKGNIKKKKGEIASAQEEASEEAGVRGKIEPEPLTTYQHPKGLVRAFLLQVAEEGHPREENREAPRWFDPETAKAKLAEDREQIYVEGVNRVIDLALERLTIAQR
jgi:8-oxo-dGTP pyrophosphatase MutT (NUDIX family)